MTSYQASNSKHNPAFIVGDSTTCVQHKDVTRRTPGTGESLPRLLDQARNRPTFATTISAPSKPIWDGFVVFILLSMHEILNLKFS